MFSRRYRQLGLFATSLWVACLGNGPSVDDGANEDEGPPAVGELDGYCNDRYDGAPGTFSCDDVTAHFCGAVDDPLLGCWAAAEDAECVCRERIPDLGKCEFTNTCMVDQEGIDRVRCMGSSWGVSCAEPGESCCYPLDNLDLPCPDLYDRCGENDLCVPVFDDHFNCGSCGHQCPPGQSCEEGQCS